MYAFQTHTLQHDIQLYIMHTTGLPCLWPPRSNVVNFIPPMDSSSDAVKDNLISFCIHIILTVLLHTCNTSNNFVFIYVFCVTLYLESCYNLKLLLNILYLLSACIHLSVTIVTHTKFAVNKNSFIYDSIVTHYICNHSELIYPWPLYRTYYICIHYIFIYLWLLLHSLYL